MKIKKKLRRIKLVVFDFDGVFTDNKVYIDQDGREMVCCWRSDGIGLQKLREMGVKTLVISLETNPIVKKRCEKLKIKCITGQQDKLKTFRKILKREKISPKEVCFVGNDTPDIECMKLAGFSIAIKGSHPDVIKIADYVTKNEGGKGAVREICDMIYNARKTTS